MSLNGKIIAITGANGNLGSAVANAFLEAGAKLELIDLGFSPESSPQPGPNAKQHTVDLLDTAATAAVFQKIGPVDVVCNIAGGFSMGTPTHETSDEEWSKMYDLNVRTLLNTSRAVVPGMKERQAGRIINVAAAPAAGPGLALMAPYLSAKGTVIKITESMSEELKSDNINVNAVMPSVIDTPPNRQAMPDADHDTWVTPQQLAGVIRFLASDEASAVHGACIPVKNRA